MRFTSFVILLQLVTMEDKGLDDPNEPQGSSCGLLSGLLSKLKIESEETSATSVSEVTILEDTTLEAVAKFIQSEKCQRIIVMAGAGISTAAGIPDFRSPNSGIYAKVMEEYQLPDPQVVFEISYFRRKPEPFYSLARELFPEEVEPTLSHYFVKLLNDKGLLLRHYTQNIDGLERKAGVPEDKVVEAHGSFYTSHCTNSSCHSEYDFDWMKDKILAGGVPKCTKCDSVIKPDVVFFGENLPKKFFEYSVQDFDKCDLLIVMGTSLVVQPFASLVTRAPKNCPRLLINREKVGHDSSGVMAAIRARLGAMADNLDLGSVFGHGFNFEAENKRDAMFLGDCDDGCKQLATALGWDKELEALMQNKP